MRGDVFTSTHPQALQLLPGVRLVQSKSVCVRERRCMAVMFLLSLHCRDPRLPLIGCVQQS
jgi:hypothetical protein